MEIDFGHAGVTVVGVLVTIITVKADLRWLREWMAEHKAAHLARDAEVEKRIRELELGK